MDEGKLFSLVRFFVAKCDSSEDIKNLLIEGGARHINYLSESVTHVIADTNCPDAEEAVELFDKPVVTSLWVHLCLKARRILPPEAFSPLKSIFRHVRASFSRDLSRHDAEILAAAVTYYGGQVERERANSTHFIAISSKPTDFQDGCNSNSNLKIVAPDWVLESVKQKVCCDETRFDPCLLLPPPPPPPPKQPTPPPLIPATQDKERSMIESNATKGPQTQDNLAKSTVSRGINHIGDENAPKVDIISTQPHIRTQNPSQQYQTQQQSQHTNTMPPLQSTQMGPRPRMATNMIRGSSPRFRQAHPSNIAQPRQTSQTMPRMVVQDNQQLRKAPQDHNTTYRKMGPYPVNPEIQHMQQQQISQPIPPYQQVEHQQGPMMGQANRFQSPNMYQQHARPTYQNSQMPQRMPANMINSQPMHRFQDPNGQVVQPRPNQVYAMQQSQPIAGPNFQQGPMQRPSVYYNNNVSNMNMRMPQQGPMVRPMISNDQQMVSEPHQQYPGPQPPPQHFYPQQPHVQQQQQQQPIHNQMVRTMQPQSAQPFQQPPPPVTQPRLQFSPSIPNAVNSHPPRGPRQSPGGPVETKSSPRSSIASQNNERTPRGPRAPVAQVQPHPSIFDQKQELSYAQMKAKVPDLTEDIVYFNHAEGFQSPKTKPFIACRFKLIEHLDVSEETRKTWCEQIAEYGGQFVDDIENATHMICETQATSEFKVAIEKGVRCITLFWIRDVISRDQYEYPWKALHMPVAFKISDKPLKNQIVTTTNYRKADRVEVKNMVEIAGAKYTDFLSSSNTLLLCGRAGGEKFERAVEWRVLIANCQLISDFIISGRDFSEMLDNAKYQNFNRGDELKLDSYAQIRKLMKPWTKPISAILTDPAPEADNPSIVASSSSHPNQDSDVATGNFNNCTDVPMKATFKVTENGDKIDSTMDVEPTQEKVDRVESVDISKTEQQEVVEPTKAIDNGSSTKECHESMDSSAAPTIVVLNTKKDDKAEEQVIKKPLLRTSKAPVRIFTTSLQPELVAQLKSHASQLGLKWANDPKESTHLLLDKINPTANFVMAFSHTNYILHIKWLIESHKFGQLLHEKDYILQDPDGETKYSFNLVHSLMKRSKRPGLLFDNYIFHITPTVIKTIKHIEKMIESAGGLWETKKLPTKNQRAQLRAEGKRFVIIADPSDYHLLDCIDTWGVDIVNRNFVIVGIIRQDIDFEAHRMDLRRVKSKERMRCQNSSIAQQSPLKKLRQL